MKNFFFSLLALFAFTACEKQSSTPAVQAEDQSLDFSSTTISICHYFADEDQWLILEIPETAWADHQAHGDVRLDDQDLDGYVPDNECGFGTMGDCNDLDPAVNPGAEEACSDNIDNNCDGQIDEGCFTFPTVVLNGLTWMAENLNIEVDGSWCYDNNSDNCTTYGRLYTWEAAQTACTQLGNGWRLPTDGEWRAMAESFGGSVDYSGSTAAYQALTLEGSSGFDAQLGGHCSSRVFYDLDVYGGYWSATEQDAGRAWAYNFHSYRRVLYRIYNVQSWGFSCRCVQD